MEDKLSNLESLLGLYPFPLQPKDSRQYEELSLEEITGGLPKVIVPNRNERETPFTINSDNHKKLITDLTKQFATVSETVDNLFKNSSFYPDHKAKVVDINWVRQMIAVQQPGFVAYSPDKGRLNEFIDRVPNKWVVLVPAGNYFVSINFKHDITLIADGLVTITAPKNQPAISCTSSGGQIQDFTFQTSEASVFPTADISDGHVAFVNCTFVGSKGSAAKVSQIAHADFFLCDLHDSEEYVLNVADNSIVTCVDTKFSHGHKAGIGMFNNSASIFTKCKINSNPEGVFVNDSASVIFHSCSITNNSSNGVRVRSNSPFIKLEKCELASNSLISQTGQAQAAINIGGPTDAVSLTIQECVFQGNRACIIASDKSQITSKYNKFTDSPDNVILSLFKNAKYNSESDSFTGNCRCCVSLSDESVFEAIRTSFTALIYNEAIAVRACNNSTLIINQCTFEQISKFCVLLENKTSIIIHETKFSSTSRGVIFKDEVSGRITNCKFSNFESAMHFQNSSGEINILNTDYTNNLTSIDFTGAAKPRIIKCNFETALPKRTKGVQIQDVNAEPYFEDCKFTGLSSAAYFKNQSHPTFKNCFYFSCSVAVTILNASPIFEKCKFSIMEEGVYISASSAPQFTDCTIEASRNHDINIEGKGAQPHFTRCQILSASKVGCIARDNASPIFDDCSFMDNKDLNLSCLESSHILLNNCELQNSVDGVSAAAEKNGVLTIKHCKIHDENNIGVFIKRGGLNMEDTEIYKCNTGVRLEIPEDSESRVLINRCKIHHNFNEAILFMMGRAVIKNNEISDNSSGIIVLPDPYENNKDTMTDNTFTNNKGKDIKVYQQQQPKQTNIQAPDGGAPGKSLAALASLPPGGGMQKNPLRTVGGYNQGAQAQGINAPPIQQLAPPPGTGIATSMSAATISPINMAGGLAGQSPLAGQAAGAPSPQLHSQFAGQPYAQAGAIRQGAVAGMVPPGQAGPYAARPGVAGQYPAQGGQFASMHPTMGGQYAMYRPGPAQAGQQAGNQQYQSATSMRQGVNGQFATPQYAQSPYQQQQYAQQQYAQQQQYQTQYAQQRMMNSQYAQQYAQQQQYQQQQMAAQTQQQYQQQYQQYQMQQQPYQNANPQITKSSSGALGPR